MSAVFPYKGAESQECYPTIFTVLPILRGRILYRVRTPGQVGLLGAILECCLLHTFPPPSLHASSPWTLEVSF